MNILVLQILCCAFMTGLIWTVQLLLYPGFSNIDQNAWSQYHQRHTNLISRIVGPVMLVELLSALLLVYKNPDEILFHVNLLGLAVIWLSTAFVSVPIHQRLSSAMDQDLLERLCRTNWPRTALWTIRLFILIAALQKPVMNMKNYTE